MTANLRNAGAGRERFTMIANDAARDRRLSMRARGVLAYLLSHSTGWRFSCASIAAQTTEGRDAVGKALRELEAVGYLRRDRRNDDAGRLTTTYVVTDVPESTEDGTESPESAATASSGMTRPADDSRRSTGSQSGEEVSLPGLSPLTEKPSTVNQSPAVSPLTEKPSTVNQSTLEEQELEEHATRERVAPQRSPNAGTSSPREAEMFARFWSTYGSLAGTGKRKAVECWNAALGRGADPVDIIAGLEAWVRYWRTPGASKAMYAQGFLNQEKWSTPPPPPASSTRSRPTRSQESRNAVLRQWEKSRAERGLGTVDELLADVQAGQAGALEEGGAS